MWPTGYALGSYPLGRLIEKTPGGIRVLGFSLAGEETVVAVPEYNVCFDVGRAPREIISIDNLCISHGHMDHAAGVAYYLSQRGFIGVPPGRVIIHRELAQSVQKLMDVWSDIEGHPVPGQIIGVNPLEDVPIRRGLLVRPFAVNHGAHALGCTLIETRRKLKQEFHDRSGQQLVALKKQGTEIEDEIEFPLVTYSGDTAVGRFLDLDFVQQSRVVLIECTFFEREHLSRARDGNHIHVDDLPKVLEAIPDAQVLLMHVTRRTDIRLAKRILERTIAPDSHSRVGLLMDRPPRRRNQPPELIDTKRAMP